MPHRKIAQPDAPLGDAHKTQDREIQIAAHAAYLAVHPLNKPHGDKRPVRGFAGDHLGLDRGQNLPLSQPHAPAHDRQGLPGHLSTYQNMIDFRDMR